MKFKIVSVKGNSVRVRSGIVTFDVLVENESGVLKMKTPNNIYIGAQDLYNLTGAVLGEYTTSLGVNTSNEKRNERPTADSSK